MNCYKKDVFSSRHSSCMALDLHKNYKKNNKVRKQKTKRYNYKTEILGCFINHQLLTEIKRRKKNNMTYYFF